MCIHKDKPNPSKKVKMFHFDDSTCFSKGQRFINCVCVREGSECYSNCLIWRSQNTDDSLKGAVKALCGTQGFRYTKQMLLSTVGLKRRSQLKYRLYIFPKVTISQTLHWSFEKLMFIILVCIFSCSNNNLTWADNINIFYIIFINSANAANNYSVPQY